MERSKDEKYRLFAAARVRGASNKEAAIEAGYSEKTASAAGSRLAKQAEVQALINELKAKAGQESTATPAAPAEKTQTAATDKEQAHAVPHPRDRAVYKGDTVELDGQTYRLTDPKDMLTLHMLGVIALSKQQQESAKALLPFAHGKVGDQGKKGAEKDAARQVVQNSLFAPMQPPDQQNSLFPHAVAH